MSYNLFLDNERQPYEVGNYIYPVELRRQYRLDEWVIVKNYLEFTECILKNGLPSKVSFDHDLGDTVLHKATDENGVTDYQSYVFTPPLQKTGWHCASWLKKYCDERNLRMPESFIHSTNWQGKENIKSLLGI